LQATRGQRPPVAVSNATARAVLRTGSGRPTGYSNCIAMSLHEAGHSMQGLSISINFLLSKAEPRSQVVRLMFIIFGCRRMFHLIKRNCVMLWTQSKTVSRKNSFLTVHHCTKYVTVPRKVRIVCVLMLADVGMLLKNGAVLVDATNKVLLRRGHSLLR